MTHKPAAAHSAFYWDTGEPSVFRSLQTGAKIGASVTKSVQEMRAAGKDVSTIPGLSKKADAILRPGKYSPSIENAAAGQRSGDKRAALRRGGI